MILTSTSAVTLLLEMENIEDISDLADQKIELGKNLITTLNSFNKIDGVQKIQRKIKQEIKFLEKVKLSKSLKLNHVTCSNLTHYEFLVKVFLEQKNVTHVDYGFTLEGRTNPLRVDIISENGAKWIKVIARNTKSLSEAAFGRSTFGTKSIIDQANEFVLASSQNLFMFKPPEIVFEFCHEIDIDLMESLENIGIKIGSQNKNFTNSDHLDVNILNLDISTMIAYVSALTNGNNCLIFREPILTEQAERERKTPIKNILYNLFKDKKLICCETAIKSFNEIISLLGGPNEKLRADHFKEQLEIHPDVDEIPKELMSICIGGKIKPRSLKIFAFGIAMKAVTVTSNEGFVRSSKMQGVVVPVFVHQARALTEMKEKTAINIST